MREKETVREKKKERREKRVEASITVQATIFTLSTIHSASKYRGNGLSQPFIYSTALLHSSPILLQSFLSCLEQWNLLNIIIALTASFTKIEILFISNEILRSSKCITYFYGAHCSNMRSKKHFHVE